MSKAWTKDIIVKPDTFGKTKACETLANMINTLAIYEKHRVLSFITDAIYKFKVIGNIKEANVKEHIIAVMKEHYYSKIDNMSYSKDICSFMKNVISQYAKKALK